MTVINSRVKISASALDFAKKLINVPLPDRYVWLERQIINFAKTKNLTTYGRLIRILERLL